MIRNLGRDSSYLDILGSIALKDSEKGFEELIHGVVGDGRRAAGSEKCIPKLGADCLYIHISFTAYIWAPLVVVLQC